MNKTKETSVLGYLRGLPKRTIMETRAVDLMAAGPDHLPKNKGTWTQATSAIRSKIRGGRSAQLGRKKQEFGLAQAPELAASLPMDVKTRLADAIQIEVTKIIDEAKRYQDAWAKILG